MVTLREFYMALDHARESGIFVSDDTRQVYADFQTWVEFMLSGRREEACELVGAGLHGVYIGLCSVPVCDMPDQWFYSTVSASPMYLTIVIDRSPGRFSRLWVKFLMWCRRVLRKVKRQ